MVLITGESEFYIKMKMQYFYPITTMEWVL